MTPDHKEFLEKVFEIAFGDNASLAETYDEVGEPRKFTYQEVLAKLREHSENAWKYEELTK